MYLATVATWDDRVVHILSTIANPTYQEGRFLILLRAKVDAGTTAEVRLKAGWNTGGVWHAHSPVGVSSTSYLYHELGTVTIPPQRLDSTFNFLDFALRLNARRTGGAGDLDMDCLVLIPVDEAFLKVDGGLVELVVADERPIHVTRQPEGTLVGYAYLGGNVIRVPALSDYNWALPPGSGVVVIAGQRATSQVITDTVDLDMAAFARWLSLRGADAWP